MVTFTRAQRLLFESVGSLFVPACPGAGKTQAMVERFVNRPGQVGRRGLALVSFTNAAIAEVEARCAPHSHLLRSPNFVGTIDGFINQFIVGPSYKSLTQRQPTFRDTWSRSHSGEFQHGKYTYRLDWFSFDSSNAAATLAPERIPVQQRNWLATTPDNHKSAQRRAWGIWKKLVDLGYIDCAHARVLMREYLADEEVGPLLRSTLFHRFYEVIVDEGQDCSDDDLILLEFLRAANINVVMVADPDQAIYEFRGSKLDGIESFSKRLSPGTRLNENFRSSSSICKLVDALRGSDEPDIPSGPYKDVQAPVHVLEVDKFSTSNWSRGLNR